MRTQIAGLALCFVMSGIQAAPDFDALGITPPKQRQAAPDFSLATADGRTLHLSDFRGKPVLLNFWATFCAPCREEMPALQTLWETHRHTGLIVLAVAADRDKSGATITAFLESAAVSFPVLLDSDGEVRRRYEVQALPTSYLIGADGRFLGRMVGPRDWDGEGYRELFASLLATGEIRRPAEPAPAPGEQDLPH